MIEAMVRHNWSGGGQECSCGQDTVTCQHCGRLVCGELATWVDGKGNIGLCCGARYGLGHAGTPPLVELR